MLLYICLVNHIRLVLSLKYPLPWVKVDAKWFYGVVFFTIKDNEQIIMFTHRVTIPFGAELLIN